MKTPKYNEIRVKSNNSALKPASGHETAYSIVNGNVLNILITLRGIEHDFEQEFRALARSTDTCVDAISDKFYDGYVAMQDSIKKLLAETTEVNVQKL